MRKILFAMMLAVISVGVFTSCGKEHRAKSTIQHLFDSIAQSNGEKYTSLFFKVLQNGLA